MNTLHRLRRGRRLSLSQLTELTGIPLRRLAEYEYEGRPLLRVEEDTLAALFGLQHQHLVGGWASVASAERPPLLRPEQAYVLAALAASAALAISLRAGLPVVASGGAGIPVAAERALPKPAITPEPRATPTSAVEAEALLASLLGVSPTPPPQASSPPTETPSPEPAHPHRCPLVPEQGRVVVLRSPGGASEDSKVLDLAADGDSDGRAEPASTRGASVVAAHDGVVQVMLDTWPGGNQVLIEGREGWRSAYAHLASVAVEPGQHVTAGELLGLAGNTGRAAGPHLEINVWHDGQAADPAELLHCGS